MIHKPTPEHLAVACAKLMVEQPKIVTELGMGPAVVEPAGKVLEGTV